MLVGACFIFSWDFLVLFMSSNDPILSDNTLREALQKFQKFLNHTEPVTKTVKINQKKIKNFPNQGGVQEFGNFSQKVPTDRFGQLP